MSDGVDHDDCRKAIGKGIRQLTEANATIAALRDELQSVEALCCGVGNCDCHLGPTLAQPIPPAAAKLLAERDAGRALYEAVKDTARAGGVATWPSIVQAVEAYRKVVE